MIQEAKGGILRILYLGTRNSLDMLENAAFSKVNTSGNAQLAANLTTAGITKLGLLASSVVEVKGDGVIGQAVENSTKAIGLLVNDVAGNPYESSSAIASEKGVYVCNMGAYEVNLFETHSFDGAVNILANYTAGKKLFASQNGLLTVEEGLDGGVAAADATVIGIITKAPGSDGFMRVQLRV